MKKVVKMFAETAWQSSLDGYKKWPRQRHERDAKYQMMGDEQAGAC